MTASIQTGRPRHRFTVGEYRRMGEAGIIDEEDRVELLDGEIVEMTPIGSRHASKVSRLNRLLVRALDDEAIVWPQNPIQLGDYSEPEPDISVVESREGEYLDRLPRAGETLLVVEVAETSLEDDREAKIRLYARHSISTAWLVNLRDESVEVFREPAEEGYGSRRTCRNDDLLAVSALPNLEVRVSDIFGNGGG